MVDRLCVVPEPDGGGTGWAHGQFDCKGCSMDLLAADEPVSSLSVLSDSAPVTVAFSGSVEAGVLPWGTTAWKQVESAVSRLEPASGQLLLRGHHGHVLADAPACLGWANHCQMSKLPCGVALSPASMIAPSMIEMMEDHLVRMFEYLGSRSGAVIIEDLLLADDGQQHGIGSGRGVLPGSLLGELVADHVPAEVPVFVLGSGLEAAARWLWPD